MRRVRLLRLPVLVSALLAVTVAGCTSAPEGADPSPESSSADSSAPGPGPAEPPASEPARSVRFSASGDFGATPATRAVLSDIAASGSDLHLVLGDLSYGRTGEERRWCDFVIGRVGEDFPFQLLAGNHESDGRDGRIGAFAECLPNRLSGMVGEYAREYYVDVPRQDPLVRFVLISPGVTFDDGVERYREGSAEYDWTAAAIDDAREAGIRWVVVAMHMPCLSVGRYGCESGADIMNLLVEKRVDLVVSGHEHNYSRTHQLTTGEGCDRIRPDRVDSDCIADRDSQFEAGAGTVFVTAGTGGAELRDIDRSDAEWGYMAAAAGLNASPTWGSLSVEATNERLTASFDRAVGDFFADSFTLTAAGG